MKIKFLENDSGYILNELNRPLTYFENKEDLISKIDSLGLDIKSLRITNEPKRVNDNFNGII